MRFEKGWSSNPGGRPKGHGEIRELARAHTMTALQTLVEIAERGVNESARVAAARLLKTICDAYDAVAAHACEPRLIAVRTRTRGRSFRLVCRLCG